MKFDAPLSSVTTKPDEAIRIITENLISTRPVCKPKYRPYRRSDVYHATTSSAGWNVVDLKKLYPDAKPGNVVYVSMIIDASNDYEGFIRYIGNAKLFIRGEEKLDSKDAVRERWGGYNCPISFKEGENNPITFMVRCESEEKFELRYMASVRWYVMWAKWYLMNAVEKSPIPEFRNEEGVGISRLYESEAEAFDGKYVYPEVPEVSNTVDFGRIYPDAKGDIAYALTYATSDGPLKIKTDSKMTVFVNGEEVNEKEIFLAEGDVVLLKLLKADSWRFTFDEEAAIGIPFMLSNREGGDKWLTLGSFGKARAFDIKYGPEYEIQFTNTYRNEFGEEMFWKLTERDDYLRPYLQSRFYGQWFYALMVGTHGLLRAAEAINEPRYKDYFVGSNELMATYYNYMQYEKRMYGRPSFLESCAFTTDLDAIGSIGRNLSELYNIKPSYETLNTINELAKAAKHNIPRFEDGTYHRPTDMWADDMFMSCPFLLRLGVIKRDNYYFEEVIRQFRGFRERLWMADEKIMSHIFFLDEQKPNRLPWGRGNGWIYVSLTDALEIIPEGFPGRDFLMDFFLEYTEGLSPLQDSDGLWHQVLNRPDSYQETSCTGMFMLGMCRGIKNGWLDRKTFMPKVENAYMGLLNKKISSTGNVYDVCMGSGNAKQVEYYMNLGAVDNDDHGTGVILTAIAEMMKIL